MSDSLAPTRPERVRGMLLGGAIGDALGSPVEFLTLAGIRRTYGPEGPDGFVESRDGRGRITDDTQMTLFTAEGMIRARIRGLAKGICDPASVVWHAYHRWLWTQGERTAGDRWRAGASSWPDGWLVARRELHARRAPGNTCLSGLRRAEMGTPSEPANDSKGCGTVMRMAPAALLGGEAFERGCEFAAITHGHPTGWIAAGAFAAMLADVLEGTPLRVAVAGQVERLRAHAHGGETAAALAKALETADAGSPTAEAVERLGGGWVAEEALAIGVLCAVATDDVRRGLRLAVCHSGDSDSTGAIAGNLLGAVHGERALPMDLLDALEEREIVATVADDLVAHFVEERPGLEVSDWGRYPGW